MRKTSKVLGIVGGSLSALMAVLIILGGVFISSFITPILENYMDSEYYENLLEAEEIEDYEIDEYLYKDGIFDLTRFSGAVVVAIGVVFLIVAVLGIVGGALAESSNVLGGVFMLVSGLVALVTAVGFIGGCLLIVGGIMAFIKEKPTDEEKQVVLAEA